MSDEITVYRVADAEQLRAEIAELRATVAELSDQYGSIPGAALTEAEACEYLGSIDRKTIARLRRDGELDFCRIGTRVVYRRIDLDSYLSRQSARAIKDSAKTRLRAAV